MISFWVDVFDYGTNQAFSAYIAGYVYQDVGSNEWHNVSAQIFGNLSQNDYAVRFGHDSSNHCVLIGEVDTVWNYMQVTVRNVQVGYSADIDDYKGDWTITFETSLPTIDETLTGNFPIASRTIGTSDVATTVTLTDQGSDSTCFPVFSTANTGDRNLHTDSSALTYDSTNGKFTSTTISGTYLEATSKLNITTSSDAVATFKMTDDNWGYMEWRKNNNDRVAYLGMDSDMDRMLIAANENGANEIEINTTTVDINASVDISNDLTVDTNTLHVDSSNNRVGIGTTSPTTTLDVEGTVSYKHTSLSADSDDLDVSGVTVVECTPSGTNRLGGLTGGVQGQILYILKVDSGLGRIIIEHNEGTGNQDIFLSGASDVMLSARGGMTLYCNGTSWFALDK